MRCMILSFCLSLCSIPTRVHTSASRYLTNFFLILHSTCYSQITVLVLSLSQSSNLAPQSKLPFPALQPCQCHMNYQKSMVQEYIDSINQGALRLLKDSHCVRVAPNTTSNVELANEIEWAGSNNLPGTLAGLLEKKN